LDGVFEEPGHWSFDYWSEEVHSCISAPTALPPAGLTRREFEVLRLAAKGLTNAQIAETLVISLATVNSYLSSVYNKLGVSSRLGAMRYVIDHHLL
jgi:DNA-binding NarL/FixJ family response regulator